MTEKGFPVGKIAFGPRCGCEMRHTALALANEVDPDDLKTTRITVQSGFAGPSLTINIAPRDGSETEYVVSYWSGETDAEIKAFVLTKEPDWTGYRMLREILQRIEE